MYLNLLQYCLNIGHCLWGYLHFCYAYNIVPYWFKWIYGLLCNAYRVAMLSKLKLTVIEIIMQSLKSIGPFNIYIYSPVASRGFAPRGFIKLIFRILDLKENLKKNWGGGGVSRPHYFNFSFKKKKENSYKPSWDLWEATL